MTKDILQWFDKLTTDEKTILDALCFGFRWQSVISLNAWFVKSEMLKVKNSPFKITEFIAILVKSNDIGFTDILNNNIHAIKAEYRIPFLKIFLHKTDRNIQLFNGFIKQFTSISEPYSWITEEQILNSYSILNQALLLEKRNIVDKTISDLKLLALRNRISNNPRLRIRNLDLIGNVVGKNQTKVIDQIEERLVWFITTRNGTIQPVIQKVNKSGIWTSGPCMLLHQPY
jgi:hypothetical protein